MTYFSRLALMYAILMALQPVLADFSSEDALLIIDVQNSFMPERDAPAGSQYEIPSEELVNGTLPDGSLAVSTAEEIVPIINDWIEEFQNAGAKIFASLDWHPNDSCSYCSSGEICADMGVTTCGENGTLNPDPSICPTSLQNRCQDDVSLNDYQQDVYTQWPNHCQQSEFGARFDPYLKIPNGTVVVKKGYETTNDSYSAYGGRESVQGYPYDTEDTSDDIRGQTSLKELLEQHGIKRLWITGVATDFCVRESTLDSLGENIHGDATKPSTLEYAILVTSACRPVTEEGEAEALVTLDEKGAYVMDKELTDPQETLTQFLLMAVTPSSTPSPSPSSVPCSAYVEEPSCLGAPEACYFKVTTIWDDANNPEKNRVVGSCHECIQGISSNRYLTDRRLFESNETCHIAGGGTVVFELVEPSTTQTAICETTGSAGASTGLWNCTQNTGEVQRAQLDLEFHTTIQLEFSGVELRTWYDNQNDLLNGLSEEFGHPVNYGSATFDDVNTELTVSLFAITTDFDGAFQLVNENILPDAGAALEKEIRDHLDMTAEQSVVITIDPDSAISYTTPVVINFASSFGPATFLSLITLLVFLKFM